MVGLIVLGILGGMYLFGYILSRYKEGKRRELAIKREEERTDFLNQADELVKYYRYPYYAYDNFKKKIDDLTNNLDKQISNDYAYYLVEDKQISRPKYLRLPKEGDSFGLCPKCKSNQLILRGTVDVGYLKCADFPYCRFTQAVTDLRQKLEADFEKSFQNNYKKAFEQ